MVPNSQVEISSNPLLTVGEFETVQRQRVAGFISHVFHLTFVALFDTLITNEEKVNHCNGCAVHHPSQKHHSCPMMDSEEAWMYYRDDVLEKIALNMVQTVVSVCSALGFKLEKFWNAHVTKLPKFPWTSIYLTSLELSQGEDLKSRIYTPFGMVLMA